MKLTEISLKKPQFTIFIVLAIVVYGIYAYINCSSQEDPGVTIREAIITTVVPGLPTSQVAKLVTKKIEEKARELPEIKTIWSSSQFGLSVVHVQVADKYFNLRPIWHELRNKMHDIRSSLPQEALAPQVNDAYGSVAVAMIALTDKQNNMPKLENFAIKARAKLYAVSGTEKVEIHGVQNEKIYLETSNFKLAKYKLPLDVIIQDLKQQNSIIPSGIAETKYKNIIIETEGNFRSIDDIRNLSIKIPGQKKLVYLRDIFTIKRSLVEPIIRPVYSNNKPAIILAVYMQKGRNIVKYGNRLHKTTEQIIEEMPQNYNLTFSTFQPQRVSHSISNFSRNLYETIIIVLLVVMVFLGVRTGLIVGSMVPLAILCAVIFMFHSGIELHRVSIAALIISLGLLVDKGVVIAEDIRRRISPIVNRRQAAIQAGEELAMPLLTSTLTTIAAFLPLMLTQNIVGEYTRSLSQVVWITLLSSWFLSIYVLPLFCSWFVLPKKNGSFSKVTKFINCAYKNTLLAILRYNKKFIIFMVVIVFSAILLFDHIPKRFFPESQRDQFIIVTNLSAGSNIVQNNVAIRSMLSWLNDKGANPEIDRTLAFVGYGGVRFFLTLAPFDPAPYKAFIVVHSKNYRNIDMLIARSKKYLQKHYPMMQTDVKKMWLGTTEPNIIKVRAISDNVKLLTKTTAIIRDKLITVPHTISVMDDWEKPVLKLIIAFDQNRAKLANINYYDITRSLQTFFMGTKVSEYREGDHKLDIVVRGAKDERIDLNLLKSLSIHSSAAGSNVPLWQIADIKPVYEFAKMQRYNLHYAITITAKNKILGAQAAISILKEKLKHIISDGKVHVEFGGEASKSKEAQVALFKYVPLSMILIISLMLWQFGSFRKTFLIIITIPLSFIGSIIGLFITQADLGFMAILGLLSLAGIVINDAIVLIDRIQTELNAGRRPLDAVVSAAATRFRPIIITSLTTILGLIPLMLFGGPLWFSMTIVLIFGLIMSTIMTLAALPVMYCWLFRIYIGR